MLTEPPIKKIDLHFPLGLEVTARNLKGVTIKDALDAIHKQFKKRVSLPRAHGFATSDRYCGIIIANSSWYYSKTTSWRNLT